MQWSRLRPDRLAIATTQAGWAARCRPPQSGSRIAAATVRADDPLGARADGPDHWSNGSLYDPQDGITYDVTAAPTAPDRISARVYRGDPLFGRTEILIRDPQLKFDGRC